MSDDKEKTTNKREELKEEDLENVAGGTIGERETARFFTITGLWIPITAQSL